MVIVYIFAWPFDNKKKTIFVCSNMNGTGVLKYEGNRSNHLPKITNLSRDLCFKLSCHSINEFLCVQIMLPRQPSCKKNIAKS